MSQSPADAETSGGAVKASELLAALGDAPASASVLVKGSRFMRMEQVVAALAGETEGRNAH